MSTIPPIPFPLRSDSYKLTHWRQYPPGTTKGQDTKKETKERREKRQKTGE